MGLNINRTHLTLSELSKFEFKTNHPLSTLSKFNKNHGAKYYDTKSWTLDEYKSSIFLSSIGCYVIKFYNDDTRRVSLTQKAYKTYAELYKLITSILPKSLSSMVYQYIDFNIKNDKTKSKCNRVIQINGGW